MSQDARSTENDDAEAAKRAAALEKFADLISAAVGPETVRAACGMEDEATDLAARVSARTRQRELSRQARIERIIGLAADEFVAPDAAAPVDPGWLDRFFECAQEAYDESKQRIWGRILARELASPGGFSRRTLGFLSAMDPWEVAGFVEYCAFAFAFESGWRFMFDEDLARREMWTYGRDIDLTQHFIAIGLLSGDTGVIKPASAKGLRVRYLSKTYEIRGQEPRDDGASSSGVAYRKFTVIGQQLAEVIRTKSFFGYARNLIKTLNAERGIGFELLEPPAES
jgi:hypothetical protein